MKTAVGRLGPADRHKDARYLDIHEDDPLDEARLAAWVKQASPNCPANTCEGRLIRENVSKPPGTGP